jgi:tetratricopeptide (TPR) repeat protein
VSVLEKGNSWVVIDEDIGKLVPKRLADTHAHVSISKEGESLNVMQRAFSFGPYARSALRYYRQAMALGADDEVVRCNAARVAYVLGKPWPMQHLKLDVATHMRLARDYEKQAADDPSYYPLAVDEYEAAVTLSPHHIDALNSYAFALAKWRLEGRNVEGRMEPDLGAAERYAREAVRLARNQIELAGGRSEVPLGGKQAEDGQTMASKERDSVDVIRLAYVQDTLGVVLLAQGRLRAAIKELEGARKLAPKHASFDEIRWHLAQAYCASGNQSQGRISSKEARTQKETAKKLFEEIKESQHRRESKDNKWLRQAWRENEKGCDFDSDGSVSSSRLADSRRH